MICGYSLVGYNAGIAAHKVYVVVICGYSLVGYNIVSEITRIHEVVICGYSLVGYNAEGRYADAAVGCDLRLFLGRIQFRVIDL